MAKQDSVIKFPSAKESHFKMIDVGRKRPTRRRAVAVGTIFMGREAFECVKAGTLPKGDVLALAEAAGINGAKKTPDMIPMCHTLPLDQVTIHCALNEAENSVSVYCQAVAFAKTGVEMEALAGVNNALLTIWDLTKGVDPDLRIGDVTLLVKTGGKSGVWINPNGIPDWLEAQIPDPRSLRGKTAAYIVISDRATKGEYEDKTGPVLQDILQNAGADIADHKVIPDDEKAIADNILSICKKHKPDLLFASGGTGPGPRDVTPEVLEQVSDRMLEGLGDVLRAESIHFTDTAWLSRMSAGMVGATLVIAFPGSPKAVKECWDILEPFLGDALDKIAGQGFK
ncbi:MAG: bifunctional molybdenum cofactor biosynthesis protein MoaC/MoaB [Alphaproteobacteria bacterium]|nr:bifunctional molybdenum cofactor biosynthesis protein MoaC/MoaB [Alphaproteobacteria bacterium]